MRTVMVQITYDNELADPLDAVVNLVEAQANGEGVAVVIGFVPGWDHAVVVKVPGAPVLVDGHVVSKEKK